MHNCIGLCVGVTVFFSCIQPGLLSRYLHHICAEEVPDGKGGFTEDTSRRVEYFRHIVMRIMRLLLEPSELECDSGFALVREVMACKVFPFLPSVVGSRNLNGWIHTALKKLEARRNAAKDRSKPSAAASGQSSKDGNTDSGAIVDNEADAAAEGEEEDEEDWDDDDNEISGDGSVQQASQPPVVSCLLPEDVDLFFSSKLADLVRRTADVRTRVLSRAISCCSYLCLFPWHSRDDFLYPLRVPFDLTCDAEREARSCVRSQFCWRKDFKKRSYWCPGG